MQIISGFESTHIFGSGQDVLDLTRHTEFFRQDIELARDCGLKRLRYSAPWHSIEREQGVYDWRWFDAAMNCLRECEIQPILDPLHHTSFPAWLTDGFADSRFVESYLKFVTALAERYEWARHYTIINEPFVTVWFCGREGVWHPHRKTAADFVRMILNVGEAICRVGRMLTEKIENARLIHVDTCEQHRACDEATAAEVETRNQMRFLVADLILGKINRQHQLYEYLRQHGASARRLDWFVQNPSRIDVLGLDYYAHSELEWTRDGRVWPNQNPVGFARVALDYVDRYNLPVMMSETNIRGFITDRLSWLKLMTRECEKLESLMTTRNLKFHGLCWYPLIDSTDWDSLVREASGNVDPQGIFWLDETRRARHRSEISEVFTKLARNEITSAEIPAYRFESSVGEMLRNWDSFTADWNWR